MVENMKIHLPVFFIIIVFTCCTVNKSYENAELFLQKNIPEAIFLNGQVVEFDQMIMAPRYMTIVDTVLLLTNSGSSNFINCYDIKNNKKIVESISRGNGPEEMISARRVQVNDTFAWIFDKQKRKIHQYEKNDICHSSRPALLKSIQIADFMDEILVLPNEKILGLSLDPNRKRFCFYDMGGNLISEVGEFPTFNLPLTPYEQAEAFIGDLVYFEDKILYSCENSDLIEIYDIDGNMIKRIHGPNGFYPKVKQFDAGQEKIGVGYQKDARDAYFSPVIYKDEIWILYSGKSESESGSNYYLKDNIIVFDWKGKPIRQYKLEPPIMTFTIDEKNKNIYALSDDPEYHIIKFDVK